MYVNYPSNLIDMFGPWQMLVNVDSQGSSVADSINLLAFNMNVYWMVGGIWKPLTRAWTELKPELWVM